MFPSASVWHLCLATAVSGGEEVTGKPESSLARTKEPADIDKDSRTEGIERIGLPSRRKLNKYIFGSVKDTSRFQAISVKCLWSRRVVIYSS